MTARCLVFAFLLLAPAACHKAQPADSPAATVARFFTAVAAGNYDEARSLLAKGEDQPSLNLDQSGLAQGYEIGEQRIRGDRATVQVTITGIDRPLPQVCLKQDGVWRLSVRETMKENTGFDPDQLANQMKHGLMKLGAKMQGSVQDSAKNLQAAPR
ncbi:MAG: hypothetical protein IPK26_04940 [Planctomycetes bacterium]|nr:hypothetical protein [Planctomycetota bacterium]